VQIVTLKKSIAVVKRKDCECGKVHGFSTNYINFLFCQNFQEKIVFYVEKIENSTMHNLSNKNHKL
jgi:hypothetical protein